MAPVVSTWRAERDQSGAQAPGRYCTNPAALHIGNMEALMAVRVPVTMGSTRSSGIEAAGLQARLVWFPGRLCLPPHSHERPTIAVIVSGSFLARTGGRDHPCPTGTLVIEPAGEDHGNLF